MPRLPIPGQDEGSWGDILNDYLQQSLSADGSLKPGAVNAAGAAQAVHSHTLNQISDSSTVGRAVAGAADAAAARSAIGAAAPSDITAITGLLSSLTTAQKDSLVAAINGVATRPTGMHFAPPKAGMYWSMQSHNFSDVAPVAQRLNMQPLFIGPVAWPIDAVRIHMFGTRAVGGTGLRFDVGLYGDDGTGFPDGSNQLFATSLTGLDASPVMQTLGSAVTPPWPGLYWLLTYYTYDVAPSTAPRIVQGYNPEYTLPFMEGDGTIYQSNAYYINSAAGLPTSTISKTNLRTFGNAWMINLRRGA